jgi:hypothetical protein
MARRGPIRLATDKSIRAATHLTDADAGMVATLKMLADRLDVLTVNDWVVEGKLDNVSVPTFLRYCEHLGLSPAGRKDIEAKKEAAGGKLAQLRAVANRSA